VVVAGAGIGGLTTALALADQGFRVCVLERAKHPQEEGAGIQLGPNATKVLNAMGLYDDIAKLSSRVNSIHIRDGLSGHTISHIPVGDVVIKRHNAPHLVIHRTDLHRILHTHADQNQRIDLFHFAQVRDFLDTGKEMVVRTTQGDKIEGRILIAADGVWSKLREPVLNDGPPISTNLIAWRCLIDPADAPHECRVHETGLWLLPKVHLVHYRVRGGKLLNLVAMTPGHAEIRGWSEPGDKQALAQAFANAAQPIQALIEASNNWYSWPLFSRPPAKTYIKGRIALLGDAAHPTLPCLAQGGAMAIEDAYILARCLKVDLNNLTEGLKKYDKLRVERTGRLQLASRAAADMYHMSGPQRLARNLTLKMAAKFAPERPLQRYDWLYGYDPVEGPLEPPS